MYTFDILICYMNKQCGARRKQKAKPLSTIMLNLLTFFFKTKMISRHLLTLHGCRPI